MPFYLGWIYKKGQCTKFFFQVSTCLSNMFTQYIQNLEIYNAFIISEPEFTVWCKSAKSFCSEEDVIDLQTRFEIDGVYPREIQFSKTVSAVSLG